MRRMLPLIVAVMAAAAALPAGEFGSRALSGWFNVTTPEGWRGRRYMDGDLIFAEEFDANNDGRIDVWRFYRRGILSSEERDLNSDGKVDLVTRWDSRTGLLTAVLRDTQKRGVNDLEVEYLGNRRWEIREDRNLDGISDSILILNAPPELFQYLDIDYAGQSDVTASVPRDLWAELWTDDAYTGNITDYYRFRRGEATHYGEWDGRRVAWTRTPPGYAPPPRTPFGRRGDLAAVSPPPARDLPTIPVPPERPQPSRASSAIRNPFDMSVSDADPDPYAGMTGMPAEPLYLEPPPPEEYRDQYRDSGGGGYYQPGPSRARGLSRDESFARSVPARMRPPGQSATAGRRR